MALAPTEYPLGRCLEATEATHAARLGAGGVGVGGECAVKKEREEEKMGGRIGENDQFQEEV